MVYIFLFAILMLMGFVIYYIASNTTISKVEAIKNAQESRILQKQRDNNIYSVDAADSFWVRQRKKFKR